MASVLKFQAKSSSGGATEIDFPLHPDTVSVEVVSALVGAVMSGIDGEARKHAKVSSSDIIQALAIAMAARATMIKAPSDKSAGLAKGLLNVALGAAGKTKNQKAPSRNGT